MIDDSKTIDPNVKDKFVDLLKKEGVRFDKQGRIHLRDLVSKIIQSKNIDTYIDRVKCKILAGKVFFITVNDAYFIVIKGNSKICRHVSDLLELVNVSGGSIVDISRNIFQFDGQKFVTFLINDDDDEKVLWIKGSHVCKFLGYNDEAQALTIHVKKKNMITFDKLCVPSAARGAKKITANTIFINFSGFCNLIHGSTKPFAEDMRNWIDDDVLPSLLLHGSYSIQPTKINIPKFYDTDSISSFYDKTVVYIGYVGKVTTKHNDEFTFKYGLSRKMFERDLNQHSKQFDRFDAVVILETDNAELIEKLFERDLKAFHLYRKHVINGKTQKELFTVSHKHTIESLVEHFKTLVCDNPLPALVEAGKIIQESNIKNDQYRSLIATHELADRIRLLEAEYKLSGTYRDEIAYKSSPIHRLEIERDIQNKQLDLQIQFFKTQQVAIEHGYSLHSVTQPIYHSSYKPPQQRALTYTKSPVSSESAEQEDSDRSTANTESDSFSSHTSSDDEDIVPIKKVAVSTKKFPSNDKRDRSTMSYVLNGQKHIH